MDAEIPEEDESPPFPLPIPDVLADFQRRFLTFALIGVPKPGSDLSSVGRIIAYQDGDGSLVRELELIKYRLLRSEIDQLEELGLDGSPASEDSKVENFSEGETLPTGTPSGPSQLRRNLTPDDPESQSQSASKAPRSELLTDEDIRRLREEYGKNP